MVPRQRFTSHIGLMQPLGEVGVAVRELGLSLVEGRLHPVMGIVLAAVVVVKVLVVFRAQYVLQTSVIVIVISRTSFALKKSLQVAAIK